MPRPERFNNRIRRKQLETRGKIGLLGETIAKQEEKTIYSQTGLKDCI